MIPSGAVAAAASWSACASGSAGGVGPLPAVAATAIAHRYWEYPAAQQLGQYINFMKNIAIMGGMVLLFSTGAGRFSVDGWLKRR